MTIYGILQGIMSGSKKGHVWTTGGRTDAEGIQALLKIYGTSAEEEQQLFERDDADTAAGFLTERSTDYKSAIRRLQQQARSNVNAMTGEEQIEHDSAHTVDRIDTDVASANIGTPLRLHNGELLLQRRTERKKQEHQRRI